MIKYFFVCIDREIFINLPKEVSRETIASIKLDVSASRVYTIVCDDVKLFLDV